MHTFDQRELATVLAALRHWQRHGLRSCEEAHSAGRGHAHWLDTIATDGGKFPPLGEGNIDKLCERLNAPPAQVELSECCHAEIGYDAWVDSNNAMNGGPYDDCICINCGTENPQVWDGKSPPWPRSKREGGTDLPDGVEEPEGSQ